VQERLDDLIHRVWGRDLTYEILRGEHNGAHGVLRPDVKHNFRCPPIRNTPVRWSAMKTSSSGGKMRKLIALLIGCFALVLTSPVRAQNAPGVSNAELNGDYAFTFNGITGNGRVSSVFAAVGRFTADGAGNLTNGELDTNGVGAGAAAVAQTFTGTYAIGADHRGVMTLADVRLAFAMMANGNAQFIEFDAVGGSGTIGSGTMEKVDTTAYSTAKITGDYAFGVAGFDNSNNRAAMAGRFTSDGAGTLTNGAGDVNAYGSVSSLPFTSANYTVSNTATGRGGMTLTFLYGGSPATLNFVFYIVNAGKFFAMERDAVTSSTPLLNGVVLRQQSPAGGFSNASLNGNMVIYLTGLSVCGGATGTVPKAVAGLLAADGNGTFNLNFDENYCSAPASHTGLLGAYIVASNGRTSITVEGNNLVAYLVSLNQTFLLVSDSNVLNGFGEPQAAGSFTNSAVEGAYAGFTITPATFGVDVFSGVFTADGASPTGSITGTENTGTSSGPNSGVAFNATYSISSSPINGRGTMTVNSGSGGSAVVYVISTSKFVAVPSDPNPAVLLFEQALHPPTLSLSSLTLNPTNVIGGPQSSTGTVTLSGPAPAGGAQVALSSSNTTTANVPSSVTVAAGATSASFTVSTRTVASSTTVTIFAAYNGATRSASLTVTPAPPPPPTVSSLTLNPANVFGGQSSTGTVTLTGPAPAGGAQVLLSSSNGAATVPSSVIVPAGATSATFTVNTSFVLISTSVTISASYNGTTRTATLGVLL
jgi:hypothetical protein